MFTRILLTLNSKSLFYFLLVANFLICLVLFWFFRDEASGDQLSYINLAESIAQGRYSIWYFIPEYIPDTFRNPGYPLFLYTIKLFTDSLYVVKLIQLLLYFSSCFFILKIIDKYDNTFLPKNIFLLLSASGIYITVYSFMIFPEILMTFLITLIFYIEEFSPQKSYKYLLLGLIYGIAFQVRPVILLFPIAKAALDFYLNKKTLALNALMLCVFFITMIPYGLWNYKNHNVFKVTSLEGGAGVMHISYWALKMPNYRETRYWGNTMGDEIISFEPSGNTSSNIEKFNKEWNDVDSICNPFLTSRDSLMLLYAKEDTVLFKSYNSKYTLARENELKRLAISHFTSEPFFFIKTKIYTAIRLWVTGVQVHNLKNSTSLFAILKVFAPFLLTVIPFLTLLILTIIVYFKSLLPTFLLKYYLVLLYFGIIHIPFAIQARYTTPVRLLLFLLICLIIPILVKPSKSVQPLVK